MYFGGMSQEEGVNFVEWCLQDEKVEADQWLLDMATLEVTGDLDNRSLSGLVGVKPQLRKMLDERE